MKLKTITQVGAALTAAFALTSAAQAVMLTGDINIGAFGSTVTLDKTLNTVDIVTAPANGTGFNATVTNSTQALSTIAPFGTFGNYNDFTYAPLSVTNPVWTFGGLTFDLTSISFIDESGPGLVLSGYGFLKAATYDDTFGTWSFSADTSGASFSWSSTATAHTPDGGTTVALLGFSLLGLHGARRKFAKR